MLVGQRHLLHDQSFHREALRFAREFCARARTNIKLLIEQLLRSGYLFKDERIHTAPAADTIGWIHEFEKKGIYLPVILQAWMMEVGSVNLTGTHPNWPMTAYCGPKQSADHV